MFEKAKSFDDFDTLHVKRKQQRTRTPNLNLTPVKNRPGTWKKMIAGKLQLFHGRNLAEATKQLVSFLSGVVESDYETDEDIDLKGAKYVGELIKHPETIEQYASKFLRYQLDRLQKDEIAQATFIELKCGMTFLLTHTNPKQPIKHIDWAFVKSYRRVIDDHRVSEIRKRNLSKQFIQFVKWLPTELESYQVPSNIVTLAFKPKRQDPIKADERFIFSVRDFRQALAAASPKYKAILLLGLNCGFTSDDFTHLRIDHITGSRLIHQREKLKRRGGPIINFKLWPETLEALRAIEKSDGTYFVGKTTRVDAITGEFSKFDTISRRWRQLVKAGKMPNKQLKGLRKTGATIIEPFGRSVVLSYLADMIPGTPKNYVIKAGKQLSELDSATDHLRQVMLLSRE